MTQERWRNIEPWLILGVGFGNLILGAMLGFYVAVGHL